MHDVDDGGGRHLGLRCPLARWSLGTAALLVVLVACQTTPPPNATQAEAELEQALELASVWLPVDESHRVRFLPPLGKNNPAGEFVTDVAIEIQAFNVDPTTGVAIAPALGVTLSTASGTVARQRNGWTTNWRARDAGLTERVSEYLRLEIRLAGAPAGPVCNGASRDCLGYLDVYAFKGGKLDKKSLPVGYVPVPGLVGSLPFGFQVLAAAGGRVPAALGELKSLTGGNFDESLGNCASSFRNRPGQGLQAVGAGLQAVGAIGGLFFGPTASFSFPPLSQEAVGAELAGALPAPTSDKNAVILVVDDFRAGYKLPPELFAQDPDLGAIAAQVSHGALVLHQLKEMADGLMPGGYWHWGYGVDGQPYYYMKDASHNKLVLQVVNVGEYDTEEIPGRIRAAMLSYGAAGSGPHASSMVLNMSFAIVPCTVMQDYEAATGLATFEEYLAALAVRNDILPEHLGDLDKLVSEPLELAADPLLAFLACPLPSDGGAACDGSTATTPAVIGSLHQVASAGNYANPYALYPAASRFVVSVGALEPSADGYAVAPYSNGAEVAAPGGLFALSTVGGQSVAFAGTSFAAPVVSLFLARDSMLSAPRCPTVDVNLRLPPPLAYGEYDMVPFYAAPGSGIEDALTMFCQDPG